jgi:hypothetical protein
LRQSFLTVRTERSAWALAFGAWSGVRMMIAPSLRKTLSKARLNLLSRSWMRNRGGVRLRSACSLVRLRACCVTQDPLGLRVIARCSMWRRSSEMKKST